MNANSYFLLALVVCLVLIFYLSCRIREIRTGWAFSDFAICARLTCLFAFGAILFSWISWALWHDFLLIALIHCAITFAFALAGVLCGVHGALELYCILEGFLAEKRRKRQCAED
jgi:hypothetical protein